MNTSPDSEQRAYAVVDDALESYPIADVPDTLLPAVLARIQTMPIVPRFRLTWFDYAISLFGACMIGGVIWLWQIFTLPSLIQLQSEILTLLQQPALLIWVTMWVGMTLMGLILIVAADLFSRQGFQLTTE